MTRKLGPGFASAPVWEEINPSYFFASIFSNMVRSKVRAADARTENHHQAWVAILFLMWPRPKELANPMSFKSIAETGRQVLGWGGKEVGLR